MFSENQEVTFGNATKSFTKSQHDASDAEYWCLQLAQEIFKNTMWVTNSGSSLLPAFTIILISFLPGAVVMFNAQHFNLDNTQAIVNLNLLLKIVCIMIQAETLKFVIYYCFCY